MASRGLAGRLNGLIGGVAAAKATGERKLQAVGANIGKNMKKADEDFESGRAPYYGSANPLKGAVKAFKNG